MQKYVGFLSKVLVFVPAAVFLSFYSAWSAIAVGSLNPAAAVIRIKNEGKIEENIYSGPNPFRDFSFESVKEPSGFEASARGNSNYSVVKEFFTSVESDIVLKKEDCYVKNLTRLSASEVRSIMLAPVGFKAEKNSDKPQILIMHTHATESYLPSASSPYDPTYAFRNTDTSRNMVAVGKVLADTLNRLGYNTLQDPTLHDYPSYNGSYDKSKETVEKYLEKYPSIKIVLDIHRDAVERDGNIIAPVTYIDGKEYAQIMIISGRDNGYMNMPYYKENLKFATTVQNQIAKDRPGLARPILFDYRNYNQQLTTGSILVEIGTHGSSLERAKNSARAFGESLAKALDNM